MTRKQAAYVADTAGNYKFSRAAVTPEQVLELATDILRQRFTPGELLSSPDVTKQYLMMELAAYEHEVFAVLFLDNRHRVIAFETLATGTINGATVYPREVVKRALHLNAAAVILSHNHPSGYPEPSAADETITRRLKEALALVDIRVLDHIVIGGTESTSFAELGRL